MSYHNKQHTTYTYYPAKGLSIVLEAGRDGVTEEDILIYQDLDHSDALKGRYNDENLDYATENQKCKHQTDPETYEDPIKSLVTYDSFSFLEEPAAEDPRIVQLKEFMKKLTPDQVDLIFDVYGAMRSQVDIAKELGVSKVAINKRLKKIHIRLLKLFAEAEKK